MSDLPTLLVLSAVMGLAIFLSLPLVFNDRLGRSSLIFLNAGAIGILVFLVADIFSDVSALLFNPSSPGGYLTYPVYDAIFLTGVVVAFLVLFAWEHRTGGLESPSPGRLGLIIAVSIGFQNLTEGLVFGSVWATSAHLGLLAVIFAGFFLQNVTEGFPIASPFLRSKGAAPSIDPRGMGLLFLVGGLPTLVGGALGYFFNSTPLDILFDAVAIGAILYSLLPMLRSAFRNAQGPEGSPRRVRLLYLGFLVGFAVGFLVNAF